MYNQFPFETIFDSEVMDLIEAFGLVQIGTPEWRAWFACYVESHYSKYWFCERVKDIEKQREVNKKRLCQELAKRNKKYSRYVHESLSYQSQIDFRQD